MIKKYKEFVEEGLLRHYNRWHKGEQRKEDKHEYVDLGLPSGLLWAKCNLGADTEYESGGYYAWGETEEKDGYSWLTYKFNNEYQTDLTKYIKKDKLKILESDDDAVHVNWGGKWRMPTKEDFRELIKNTKHKWVFSHNGVESKGILFTSKINGNTLFFPVTGIKISDRFVGQTNQLYYWSSSRLGIDYNNAYTLYAKSTETFEKTYNVSRYFGICIKGVMEK